MHLEQEQTEGTESAAEKARRFLGTQRQPFLVGAVNSPFVFRIPFSLFPPFAPVPTARRLSAIQQVGGTGARTEVTVAVEMRSITRFYTTSLYKTPLAFTNRRMNFYHVLVVGIVGSIVLILIVWLIATGFSQEARVERRRRKSNSKVVNRAGRPTVKFSAKIKDDKKGQT